ALELASRARLLLVQGFLVRRIAALGTPEAIALLVERLGKPGADLGLRRAILRGLNEAVKGRRQGAMPVDWATVSRSVAEVHDAEIQLQANTLALTLGDAVAQDRPRRRLSDGTLGLDQRRAALDALLRVHDLGLPPVLQALLSEQALR